AEIVERARVVALLVALAADVVDDAAERRQVRELVAVVAHAAARPAAAIDALIALVEMREIRILALGLRGVGGQLRAARGGEHRETDDRLHVHSSRTGEPASGNPHSGFCESSPSASSSVAM